MTALPEPNSTLQSWLRYREFGQGAIQPPVTEKERAVSWLRYMQKKRFDQEVSKEPVTEPDRLDNPPQSLKEILEQRLPSVSPPKPQRPPKAHLTGLGYDDAIRNGLLAGLLMGVVLGIVYLIVVTR